MRMARLVCFVIATLAGPAGEAAADDAGPYDDAMLTLDGIVNNPAYAVNNAQRGKLYSYRIRARFGATTGSGQRIGRRKCDFQFKRL